MGEVQVRKRRDPSKGRNNRPPHALNAMMSIFLRLRQATEQPGAAEQATEQLKASKQATEQPGATEQVTEQYRLVSWRDELIN